MRWIAGGRSSAVIFALTPEREKRRGAEPGRRGLGEGPVREAEQGAEKGAGQDRGKVRAAFTGPAAAGMEASASEDPSFSPDDFVRGARKAYELIVTAFAEGDRDSLRALVDQDVFEVYSDAIAAHQRDGTEPMRLMRVRQARIVEASVDANHMGRVLVSFESDLSDGENLRAAKEIWTFKRPLRSEDPNWLLDEVATAS